MVVERMNLKHLDALVAAAEVVRRKDRCSKVVSQNKNYSQTSLPVMVETTKLHSSPIFPPKISPPPSPSKLSSKCSLISHKPLLIKPKRPLSAYNIFFRHERAKILGLPIMRLAGGEMNERSVKRRHVKVHGKIGFSELGKLIGKNWRELPSEKRSFYVNLALGEKENYMKKLQIFQRTKKALSH
mmetsp:Transcript_21213/g.27336  ORF Transcript_21213/g.27336 Transcript_21213/m.27336 type:complete len:185 (+) Transcript_21213:211-765(+)